MPIWNNLSIRWKLAAPIALMIFLIIGVMANQIGAMNSMNSNFSSIQTNYFKALELTLNADRDLYQAQIAERTIAMGKVDQTLIASFQDNVAQVRDRITQLDSLNISPNIKAKAKDFLVVFEQWHKESALLIQQAQQGSASSLALTDISLNQLEKEFNRIREILNTIGEELANTSNDIVNIIYHDSERTITTSIAVNALIIIIGLLLALFLPKAILAPITKLQHSLSAIASGNGDLTARIKDLGNDELGTVSKTFNHFLESLHALVSNIRGTSGKLTHHSESLDTIVDENNKSINELAGAIHTVAAAVTEMGAAIGEVSRNSQQVSNETDNADQQAQNVGQIFRDTISEIRQLSNDVDQSVAAIKLLENEAGEIASVIDVIQGIAEQTNLLALNAAIEAARAGEQGRGFAVVADEVRNLASKTQESTEHINDMINKVQQGVTTVVKSMAQVNGRAESTVSSATDAETSLQEVTKNLSSISGRIIQVASAVEEQSTVINDINQNIEIINMHANDVSSRAKDVGHASKDFRKEFGSLNGQISEFKV